MTTPKPSETPARGWKFRVPLPKTVTGRRRVTTVVVLIGSGLAGYLTTCIAYPGANFQRDHVVTRVIGMPIAQAEQALMAQGFKVQIEGEEADPEVPAGAVLWQDPPPDLVAPQGTTVNLTRSAGPSPILIPDLTDFDLEAAIRVLIAAGLKVGEVDTVPGGADPDVIVGTRPGAGAPKGLGSPVDLIVSQGPVELDVPNVVGLRPDDARRQLEAAGFTIGRIKTAEGRRGPPGTILEQIPSAGARAARRTRIDLVVSEVN